MNRSLYVSSFCSIGFPCTSFPCTRFSLRILVTPCACSIRSAICCVPGLTSFDRGVRNELRAYSRADRLVSKSSGSCVSRRTAIDVRSESLHTFECDVHCAEQVSIGCANDKPVRLSTCDHCGRHDWWSRRIFAVRLLYIIDATVFAYLRTESMCVYTVDDHSVDFEIVERPQNLEIQQSHLDCLAKRSILRQGSAVHEPH